MKVIDKLKTLVGLKDSLIEALRGDLERAVRIINQREQRIADLELQIYMLEQAQWLQQDSDRKWIDEQLSRIEAEERGEDHVSIDIGLQFDPDRELAIADALDSDIPFEEEEE